MVHCKVFMFIQIKENEEQNQQGLLQEGFAYYVEGLHSIWELQSIIRGQGQSIFDVQMGFEQYHPAVRVSTCHQGYHSVVRVLPFCQGYHPVVRGTTWSLGVAPCCRGYHSVVRVLPYCQGYHPVVRGTTVLLGVSPGCQGQHPVVGDTTLLPGYYPFVRGTTLVSGIPLCCQGQRSVVRSATILSGVLTLRWWVLPFLFDEAPCCQDYHFVFKGSRCTNLLSGIPLLLGIPPFCQGYQGQQSVVRCTTLLLGVAPCSQGCTLFQVYYPVFQGSTLLLRRSTPSHQGEHPLVRVSTVVRGATLLSTEALGCQRQHSCCQGYCFVTRDTTLLSGVPLLSRTALCCPVVLLCHQGYHCPCYQRYHSVVRGSAIEGAGS